MAVFQITGSLTVAFQFSLHIIVLLSFIKTNKNLVQADRAFQIGLEKCADCRLTSNSVDELLRKPRQMDSYGQFDDRIDLDKIKKAVCKDIVSDKERERCRNFYFSHPDSIGKWKHSNSKISFFDFVCIKDLKLCCPRDSFGSKCSKCAKCGPNERCHGEGIRSGNGTCICKKGHTGTNCTSCLPGYYYDSQPATKSPGKKTERNKEKQTEDKSVLCKPCHRSCKHCRRESPLGCEVCQSGFTWIPGYGCSDIDECVKSESKVCGDNTFCVNTEGSYFCYECDRACDGCHGDGPDMCLRCGEGYEMKAGNCVALKRTIIPPEANYYRYAIYTGLCLCTCILLHNNVYLASFIGLGVAMYIALSEYIMSTHTHNMEEQSTQSMFSGESSLFKDLNLN